MSLWSGKYLTGFNGYLFSQGIAKENDLVALRNVKKKLGLDVSKFEPWMSHVNDLENMSHLISLRKEDEFLLDHESLIVLSKVLSINGDNLKRIHHHSNDKIGVQSPNDSNYNENKIRLKSVLKLLNQKSPYFFIYLKNMVNQIVIQVSTDKKYKLREEGTGLSTFNYRRAIFLSIPNSEYWEVELLLNLWHELGHQTLINLQLLDKIILDSHTFKIFSVIRKKDRPAILSLHALVATSFMIEFLIENKKMLICLSSERIINDKLEMLSESLKEGLDKLKGLRYSELGNSIYKELIALYIYQGTSR